MIFDFISPLESFKDIDIKNLSQERITNKSFGFLEINNNKLQLFCNKKLYNIEILKNDYDIKDLLNKGIKALVYVKESIRDRFATIDIYFFYFTKELIELDIKIDDKVLESAKKSLIKPSEGLKELKTKILQDSKIDINGYSYFILTLSKHSKEDDFKNSSFLLYCDEYILSIKREKLDSNESELKINKILKKQPQNANNLVLLKADIKFGSGLISDKLSEQLQQIIQDDNSYISVWNRFLDFEGEILLNRAKEIGVIEISKIIPQKNNLIEVVLSQKPSMLNVKDSIGFFEKQPNYLKFEKFQDLERDLASNELKNELFFEIKYIKENSIFIKTENYKNLLCCKLIALSIYGDKVQILRKLKARELILTGKAANPFLGLILEESATLQIDSKMTKIEPLSEFVEKKVFSKKSTPNQKEAISIAINTPDIAIIQGPPGTGKTTVITAIIERLNELKGKESIKGRVLVAGYQHDAVTNLAERLSVNSLPAVKFSSKDTEGEYQKYLMMMKWVEEIKEKAKQNVRDYSNEKRIKEVNNLINIYLSNPSNQTALNILDKIRYILPDSIDKIDELKQDFIEEFFDISDLKAIYGLRVTKEAFSDDGAKRIDEFLKTNFVKILDYSDKKKLEKKDINLLDEYKKIRIKLIKYFYPKPRYQKPKPNEKLLNFLEEIQERLKEGNTKQDKKNKILFEYVSELENNPFALFEMIKDYSFVFASSVQQSDRKDIESEKEDQFYDVVIIDEAGRVPPMDLFVPIVKGKKIILVGDHRQLPHLVDDNIIEELTKNQDIEEDLIKKSIFEYLINRAKQLQEKDGVKRVITLNNQYRTNPVMGKFISKSFYEPYNEGFNSPLPMELFTHNLKDIENLPCVWMDVSYNRCGEKKDSNYSTYRECEAKKIIEYLKKWIYSKDGENLSYGIISFYKAQVNLIKKLISKELPDKEDKIKVGSVDAFQGMEFDVVFLSATRSKRPIKGIPRSLFGFLVSKNRLNVAMTRQKKVLIGVGDREYFQSDIAKKYVSEINEFIELCRDKGKIL